MEICLDFTLSFCETVYPPAEDSVLLAKEASKLKGKILEIGCGSGICSIAAAAASPKNQIIGVDINPAAVSCSKKNANANNAKNCTFYVSDLFSNVPKGEKFDYILFNPPYLPTADEEKLKDALENAAYDGGKSGMRVIAKFLREAPAFLKKNGKILIVATSLGNVDGKIAKIGEKMGFESKEISCEKFFFEKIGVLELEQAFIAENANRDVWESKAEDAVWNKY